MTKACLLCGKLLNNSQKKFCSIKCARNVGNKILGKILHERITGKYPMFLGFCKNCNKEIIAKNAGFVKSNRQFCSVSCKISFCNTKRVWTKEQRIQAGIRTRRLLTGIKRSPETKERMRLANLGSKSHFWLGGLTEKNRLLRNSSITKNWRESCFKRNNYTCQDCKLTGGKLCVHHIVNWCDNKDLRWDINNGVTLCWKCHYKRHKNNKFWKKRLQPKGLVI